ncbi:MAG TPA: NAD-dependent epimerase/dehydratase family protein [Polyangiaceae bacterium]|jgi:uncharacterized protein YbjT (DUF2867 family)|nr:NAD-dependent epimerase/dehydratase family protein [Polyangiaceae bacterium]
MKVVIFGATGMVGQGVLRECLLDPDVDAVVTVGRSATGKQSPKLHEIVHADLLNPAPVADQIVGFDAGFFCLGVSSAGMTEADYRHVTYDLTLAIAHALAPRNPAMTFVYVSGAGTDGSGGGRSMWARVKGATENALMQLPFKASYMFRPGYIHPLHGIVSKTPLYRAAYVLASPLYPVLKALFPAYVTTTEQVGRAMLAVAKGGAAQAVLENRDINGIAASGAPST